MLFSKACPLLGALLANVAYATPAPADSALAPRTSPACTFDLSKSWNDEILFQGVAAPEIAGVQDAVQLGLRLPQAALSGSIAVSVTDSFLISPLLKVDLGGVKVYLELDVSATAGVSESLELFASPELKVSVRII
jgi:hypothetical protein